MASAAELAVAELPREASQELPAVSEVPEQAEQTDFAAECQSEIQEHLLDTASPDLCAVAQAAGTTAEVAVVELAVAMAEQVEHTRSGQDVLAVVPLGPEELSLVEVVPG